MKITTFFLEWISLSNSHSREDLNIVWYYNISSFYKFTIFFLKTNPGVLWLFKNFMVFF